MTRTETIAPVANAADAAWCDEVLRFWFDALSPEAWWHKDDVLDAHIHQRFGALYEAVASQAPLFPGDARTALATVIVLDQFPRNMFRGHARAYATDAQARALAKAAIAGGLASSLSKDERLFLYMPLQHSEDADDQRRSVELVSTLGDEELTHFALAHQRIIDRFGRFPHRNAILGRRSTPEEIEFLQSPASSF
jgi:uncharacterized protein (DUF924 family)